MNLALFFCLLVVLSKPTESIDNTVARAMIRLTRFPPLCSRNLSSEFSKSYRCASRFLRNQYLRFYVFDKKRILHRTYNYLLSKYHDSFIFYYSLSEKERELFDQVMNTWY